MAPTIRLLQTITLFLLLASSPAVAQFLPYPLGANRPDVSWLQFETDHFVVIYHEGLESFAREAADVAEAIYPVVTGNLRQEIPGRTPLFLSDLDDVPNAFAMGDAYMYIWMRGILDDMPLGGIRSSGRAKWFRAVITHEFTHVVIAHATKSWMTELIPQASVPRWFNEGTARFMEPDGWTADVDQVLRIAAISGRLDYGGRLGGTLLYETGHSLVRFMTTRFGDTVLARILHAGHGAFGYNFERAVRVATGKSMGEIRAEWQRSITALYGTEYATRPEMIDLTPPLVRGYEAVFGIRLAPNGRDALVYAATPGDRPYLYLHRNVRRLGPRSDGDTTPSVRVVSDETGFDEQFSWSPDSKRVVLSKLRHGEHNALVHDLYVLDVESESLRRLTDDASLSDPEWSPDGRSIVAVEKRIGRDNLVLIDAATGARRRLTTFADDTQIYTPSWSPDGTTIAFSLFDPRGVRAVASVVVATGAVSRLTDGAANDRYPVWSPDGRRIAYTSHASGIPNIRVIDADGRNGRYLTDVAGGAYSVQWAPATDSVLVISFDARDGILPHLVGADRSVTPASVPPVQPKYTAWRSVSLPRQVPPADSIRPAVRSEADGYSSLGNLYFLLPFVPYAGSDLSRDGAERGIRLGGGTVLSDPMVMHILFGYLDYGLRSNQIGGELYYINNYFPFTITTHVDYSLGFRRYLSDRVYHQRNRGIGIQASLTLPASNTFSMSQTVAVGAGHRSLEPWNAASFDSIGTGELRPLDAKLSELHAAYRLAMPDVTVAADLLRSEPALGSDLEYTRAELSIGYRAFPSGGFLGMSLPINLDLAAQWGDQLPQEFLGLDRYDQLEGGINVSELADLSSLRSRRRVRGVRRYMYGDRVAVGSVGLQWDPSLFTSLLPVLTLFDPHALLFVEAGSAWNSATTAIGDAELVAGYGAELRFAPSPGVNVSAGIAFEMISRPRRDLYLRLGIGL